MPDNKPGSLPFPSGAFDRLAGYLPRLHYVFPSRLVIKALHRDAIMNNEIVQCSAWLFLL
jgi:hypothetical protein